MKIYRVKKVFIRFMRNRKMHLSVSTFKTEYVKFAVRFRFLKCSVVIGIEN